MIRTPFRKHQKLAITFMKLKKVCALFMDYGTGKTLCALADIVQKRVRKVLVVSSKTAIESTWAGMTGEICKHTNFRYVVLIGSPVQKYNALRVGLRNSYTAETPYSSAVSRPVIFLINFDGIRNIYDHIKQADFDMIIVDESTKIKSPLARRTQILWKLGQDIPYKTIMTGFPITENLAEIYSQIKFLDGGKTFGNSYYSFLERYFFKAGFKRILKRGGEKKIFKLIEPFCFRVSNDVLQLPPKVYQQKIIEPTDIQKKLLDDFRTYFQLEFGKIKLDTDYIFTLINKSLQICDGFLQDGNGNVEAIGTSKDEAIIDVVEDIDPNKNKVIIWATFRFSVKKLAKIFTKLGYNTLTLTGETPNVSQVVRKFQYDKKINLLVATQKKASESITLTNCRHAIYYSNSWSYDARVNSEARIRRIGSEKHKSIIYTDIMLTHSIEKLVYDCLKGKKNLVDKLKKEFKTVR
jgi:SNF2 family DNA or RNA helicase